jgi:uncharacterized membrane protein
MKVSGSGKQEGSNVVAGQVFDAMSVIQLYCFLVCRIISTANHWRIVGKLIDDEQKNLANADTIVQDRLGRGTNSKERLEEIKRRFNSQTNTKNKPCQSINNDSPK